MRGKKHMSDTNVPLFRSANTNCRVQKGELFQRSGVRERQFGFARSKESEALLPDASQRRRPMSLGTILLIILILLLVGALPTWPYSGGWGYYPSGGLGLVLVIVLILLLLGRI